MICLIDPGIKLLFSSLQMILHSLFFVHNNSLNSLQATKKVMVELMKCDLGFYHHRVSLIAVVRGMVTRL